MSAERPDARFIDDAYVFEWPEQRVRMDLERFHETRDDIRCELTVTSVDPVSPGRLYSGRLLLIGPNSLRDCTRLLLEREPQLDWGVMLAQARDLARDRFRSGDPIVDLRRVATTGRPRYLVYPVVYEGAAISMLYGMGETAKSLMGLAFGVAVASGEPVFMWEPSDVGPVVYLDWEDDAETHAERLQAITRGAGIDAESAPVYYQRMALSLASGARDVRKKVSELGARLVIVDSLGLACGGDPQDASVMIETLIAARSLNVPVLVIHHMSKTEKDKKNPYGSVYGRNEVRLAWHVEGEVDRANITTIRNVYTNTKANRGVTRHAIRLAIDLQTDGDSLYSVTMRELDSSEAIHAGVATNRELISDSLSTGDLTVKDIMEATGLSESIIRTTLNRGRDRHFVRRDNARNGCWGLAAPANETRFVTRFDTERNNTPPLGGVTSDVSQGNGGGSEMVTCFSCKRDRVPVAAYHPKSTNAEPWPLCAACADEVLAS